MQSDWTSSIWTTFIWRVKTLRELLQSVSIIDHACGIFLKSPGYTYIKYDDPRCEVQKCPKSNVLTIHHGMGDFFLSKSDHACSIFSTTKNCVPATFWQPWAHFGNFYQIVATFYNLWDLLATCNNIFLGNFWQFVATFSHKNKNTISDGWSIVLL